MENKNQLFSTETYSKRRSLLKKKIMGTGVLLFLGNKESSINFKDNWYPYRQDSTFLYYFGLNLPGLHALIDLDSGKEIIFGDDLTLDEIVWTGPQPTIAEMSAKVGIKDTYTLDKMTAYLSHREVHYLPVYRPEHTVFMASLFNRSYAEIDLGYSLSFIKEVAAQRAVKSPEELSSLHEAASITSQIHLTLMQQAKAGMKEYELASRVRQVAHEQNVNISFQPIVTIEGQILHNHYYGNTLSGGDMLLCDAGAESSQLYAGDMTRTFPVDSTFSSLQKELYDVVHRSHLAAIAAMKPGIKFLDLHLLVCRILVEGLIEVGLMKGQPEEAVAAGAHTMFFQCGLGHMMGLDVHDMENLGEAHVGYNDQLKKSDAFGLKSLRLGKELASGYVVTVEPGIYIIPELIKKLKASGDYNDFINYSLLEKHADFGGIRIEDDFAITPDGAQLLGRPLASTSDDIESIRKAALS